MTEVAQGTSLARFGHGELLIMARFDAKQQKFDMRLHDELWGIWTDSPCLIACPPFDPPGWEGFLEDCEDILNTRRWYGSSFVSRHDWVPWTEEYKEVLYSVLEHDIIEVAPYRQQFTSSLFNSIITIDCGKENSFKKIDKIEASIERQAKGHLVLLCCGPTATVLADRLARKGIWAVDLGNFGRFL